MEQSAETPRKDLMERALAHYEKLSDMACHWNSIVPEAIRLWGSRDELAAENAALRAQVATLTAERDRLKAWVEHYADERNWTTATDFDNNYVIYCANFPMPGDGYFVAQEALAGGTQEPKSPTIQESIETIGAAFTADPEFRFGYQSAIVSILLDHPITNGIALGPANILADKILKKILPMANARASEALAGGENESK